MRLPATQEAAMLDAMAERMLEESPDVQREKAEIASKQATRAGIEDRSAKGKQDPMYAELTREIRNEQEGLERLRIEMKPRIRRKAELAMASREVENDIAQRERQKEELGKLRLECETARVKERLLKSHYEDQRKNVEQNSGDTMELAFKADELSRAEKVFEQIAQRVLNSRPSGAPRGSP